MSSLSSNHITAAIPSTSMSTPDCLVPFLERLPRELRNLIYAELWNETPVIEAKYKGIHMVLQSLATRPHTKWRYDCKSRMRNLPIWLRTCKTVLHEGLEELRARSTWTVGPYDAPYDSPCPLNYYRSCGIATKYAGALLNPTTTGRITIRTNALRLDKPGATFTINPNDMEYIRILAARLKVTSRVRILRLTTIISSCHCECNCYVQHRARGWRLNLTSLARCSFQLESFEFQILHFKDSEVAGIKNWNFCHAFFAEEIERVGKLWVGEEGVLTMQASPGPADWDENVLYTFSSAG